MAAETDRRRASYDQVGPNRGAGGARSQRPIVRCRSHGGRRSQVAEELGVPRVAAP